MKRTAALASIDRFDPIEQLNLLMKPIPRTAGREAWRQYFEPVPELSRGLPVPLLGIMVLIWQLRERDLKEKYPLQDIESRLGFISWCLWHGSREYQALREADQFWDAVERPAQFGSAELAEDDPGRCISWQMVLMQRQRPDLNLNLDTVEGRRQFLTWYLLHGQRELSHVRNVFLPWQTEWLFKPSSVPGLSRFQLLVYQFLPRVQEAMPLPQKREQYRNWLRKHFCLDTRLVDSLVRLPATVEKRVPLAHPEGVNVIGYAFGQLGIGEDARLTAKALAAADVPFTMLDFPPGKEIPQEDRSMEAHVTAQATYATNLFCMTALEQGRYFAERGISTIVGRNNIGYWPWELPRFPRQWEHLLGLVDEVWVSSRYIQKGLDHVSPVKVRVMPLAVEPTKASGKTRADFGLPLQAKLFIFAFDLNSSAKRKNPAACIEAFRRAYPQKGKGALGKDKVGLVIKVMGKTQDSPDWEMLTRLRASDPRIHLIDQTLPKPDLIALYQACDCFVSLHRAEGFGRGLAEYMLMGKPVITTAFSGNLDFTREDNALLVSHALVELAPDDYPYGDGQAWADPDVQVAAAKMQQVFRGERSVKNLAAKGQQTISTDHSVQSVGKRMETALLNCGWLKRGKSATARQAKRAKQKSPVLTA